MAISKKVIETSRHHTAFLEAGPEKGPLLIFLHGFPELSIVWRRQLEYFSGKGWRCIAPDMRGYGGSSVPHTLSAYSVKEITLDMVELHDALGGEPAVWIGHDWGAAIVWSLAAHYASRCSGIINMCIPYFTRGLALQSLLPLVDRTLYPTEKYPAGQWDYFLFYKEHFQKAVKDFEGDTKATLATLHTKHSLDKLDEPAASSTIRLQEGWFGKNGLAPQKENDESLVSQTDFDAIVQDFSNTGFGGAIAWYMNEAANLQYADEAPRFGHLSLPVLFLHAAYDKVCETVNSHLANPMREDCSDLTEVIIHSGHEMMLEEETEVNAAIEKWLSSKY